MSARVISDCICGGDCFFPVSGVPAHAAAEWASQLTVTSGGPMSPGRGIAAATRAACLADGTGKVPRASQRRHAVRLCWGSS